jgi:hypothetical protein
MSNQSLTVTAIAFAVLLALTFLLPWWPLNWSGKDYWEVVGNLATVIASILGVVFVALNYGMWREAALQREGALMLQLTEGYDRLREDVDLLRQFYIECAANGPTDPIERFRYDVAGLDFTFDQQVASLDDARFRISRFFVGIRRLVKAGFLSERVVIAALNRRAIEYVFLKLVDPLDEAKAGTRFNPTDRDFYRALLNRFPDEGRL